MFRNLSNRRTYLDYASLTPIDPRVSREVLKYSSRKYANPSSLYSEGVAAKKALAEARARVAGFIHAHPNEIIFTSGGTEANGLALEGVARVAVEGAGIVKPHVIISAIEHSSVMEVAKILEKHGCEVTRISIDSSGLVSLEGLKKALKENTILVSIMTVNNEVGTIQPIREIAKVIRQFKKMRTTSESKSSYPLFHTDAAQAATFMGLNMENFGVDLLTLDASKVYGTRGVGCLYIKRGTPIQPIIYGGGQEAGMRSGTENIPGIMGFAKALELIGNETEKGIETTRLNELRTMMIDGLKTIRSDIVVNGVVNSVIASQSHKAPHILNVSIPSIDNEFLLFQLDAAGVACSTKSSCLRDEDESYVLKAMGADSKTSLRFSFGRFTKGHDITRVLKIIRKVLDN